MLFMFCRKTMRTNSSSSPSARLLNKRPSRRRAARHRLVTLHKHVRSRQRAQKPEPLHVLGQTGVEAETNTRILRCPAGSFAEACTAPARGPGAARR